MPRCSFVLVLLLVASTTAMLGGCGGASSESASAQAESVATGAEAESAAEPVVVRDAVQEEDGTWIAGLPLGSSPAVGLAAALDDPEAHAGRLVRTTARIEQVCQVSGCWMIVSDGGTQTRVTFADYGFFVPKHVAGATVEMDVRIERTVMDEETARHLASETEGEDPDAITGPVETIAVVATGVRIHERTE